MDNPYLDIGKKKEQNPYLDISLVQNADNPYFSLPQVEPQKPNPYADIAVGTLEVAANLFGGMVAFPTGGIAGLAGGTYGILSGKDPTGWVEAGKWQEAVTNLLTNPPTTKTGETGMKIVQWPFQFISDQWEYAGDQVLKLTKSPAVATAVKTLGEAGTYALLGKAGADIKGEVKVRVQEKVADVKAIREAAKLIDEQPPEVKATIKQVVDETRGKIEKPEEIYSTEEGLQTTAEAIGKQIKTEKAIEQAESLGPLEKAMYEQKEIKKPEVKTVQPNKTEGEVFEKPVLESELGQVELPQFGEIAEGLKAPFQRAYSWLDVQAPFVRAGAERTGMAVKEYYSQIISEQERALGVAKKLTDLTPEESYEIGLKAADETRPASPKVTEGAKQIREYFDQAAERAQADGVLKNKWPEGQIERLNDEIMGIEKAIEATKGSKQPRGLKKSRLKKLEEQKRALKMAIEDINVVNPKYVHIPLNHFINKIYEEFGRAKGNEIIAKGTSAYKGRFFKQRKTIDIEKFYNWTKTIKNKKGKPLFTAKDYDVRIAVGNYANQLGRMRALGKIFKAAYSEKLIVDKSLGWPDGYGEAPLSMQIRFPELKGKYIHNAFADYLMKHMDTVESGMKLGRFFGYTKMMAFYNPFFLPAYDMWQGSWLGSMRSLKSPLYLKEGIKSVFKRDKLYYENLENGGFSTPYAPPFENFMKQMTQNRYSNPVKTAMQIFGKSVVNPVDNFYKAVWNMAWSGDHAIRMASYHYLTKKMGLPPGEAAQFVAHFHGDYARLTPKARKIFNKVWFTPTFKYAMGHLQVNMIKSSCNVMMNALKMKKSSQRDMIYAKGALALIAGQFAKDQIFRLWGFAVDEFGMRYSKTVKDDEGKEKELVVYWPDPGNLFMRYVHRYRKWGVDANHLEELFYKSHWDFHPIWALGMEIAANKKADGGLIYNMFDINDTEMYKDIAWYGVTRIVGAADFIEERFKQEGDKKEAYKKLKEETNVIWATFLQTATLAYLRDPDDVRIARVMRQMQKFFRWNMYVDPDRTYPETYVKKMRELQKELEEIQKEKANAREK